MNEEQSSFIKVVAARGLTAKDPNPYCVIGASSSCRTKFQDIQKCVRSETVQWTLAPTWKNAVFPIEGDEITCYRVEVWDKDWDKDDDFLGFALIEINEATHVDKWITLKARSREEAGDINVEIVRNYGPSLLSPSYLAVKINLPLSPFVHRLIYGASNAKLKLVAPGAPRTLRPPSMHPHSVALMPNGEIDIQDTFKCILNGFKITNPKTYQREGLLLVRGDDSEAGICYDANSTRYFFVFSKSDMKDLSFRNLKYNNTFGWEKTQQVYQAFSPPVKWNQPVIFHPSTQVTVYPQSNTPSSIFSQRVSKPFVVTFFISTKETTKAKESSKEKFLNGIFPWMTIEVEPSKVEITITAENAEKQKIPFVTSKPDEELIRAIREKRAERN